MRPLRLSILAATFLMAYLPFAVAAGVTAARLRPAPDDPSMYLVDGRPLTDERRIASMRERGELPDTIRDGTCNFQLAGDPGVVYYVRECP